MATYTFLGWDGDVDPSENDPIQITEFDNERDARDQQDHWCEFIGYAQVVYGELPLLRDKFTVDKKG